MEILFFFQTTIGLLGNSSLLYFHTLTFFTKHSQRPADLILNHLVLANSLVLFSRGIPQTLTAFGLKYCLGDADVNLAFIFTEWPGGFLSEPPVSSGFQAVTIHPSNSRWAELKPKAPKFVKPPCLLCWILHLLINIIVPVRVTSPRNTTNITEKDFGLCSVKGSDSFTPLLYAFLFSFLDILCLGPMGWASGSIVLFLHGHKQRPQYIRHTSLSPRAPPETTATYTGLLLVTSSVSFHSVSSIVSLYMTHFVNPSLRLVNISTFLAACFPAFSPFVLISCDTRIFRTYVSCGKTKISK